MNRDNLITLILLTIVLLGSGTAILLGKPHASTADTLVLLQAQGMTCSSCSQKITQSLTSQSGVAAVAVDVPAGIVEVQIDSRKTTPVAVAGSVSSLGFTSTIAYVQPFRKSGPSKPQKSGCGSNGCGNCNQKQSN